MVSSCEVLLFLTLDSLDNNCLFSLTVYVGWLSDPPMCVLMTNVCVDGQVVSKLIIEARRLKQWLTASQDDRGAVKRVLHECHVMEMQLNLMPTKDLSKSLRREYLEPLVAACEWIIHVASLSATEIKSSLIASGLHAHSWPPLGFKGLCTKDELVRLHVA